MLTGLVVPIYFLNTLFHSKSLITAKSLWVNFASSLAGRLYCSCLAGRCLHAVQFSQDKSACLNSLTRQIEESPSSFFRLCHCDLYFVLQQARAEQEEEFISNTLFKKIQALQKEKETLAVNYEKEEEFLTNELSRKLMQVSDGISQGKCSFLNWWLQLFIPSPEQNSLT